MGIYMMYVGVLCAWACTGTGSECGECLGRLERAKVAGFTTGHSRQGFQQANELKCVGVGDAVCGTRATIMAARERERERESGDDSPERER